MVREQLPFSRIVDRHALENAIRINAALGGSTNAILHLTAIAGRLGIGLTLADFEANCRGIPLLANVSPNGTYLLEEFYSAGGLPALMAEMAGILNMDALTVTGTSLRANIADAKSSDAGKRRLVTAHTRNRHRHAAS
jgi:dihydroxyacid dehydratase/phosphogluconate dehydratase